jgi:hypothetical protein
VRHSNVFLAAQLRLSYIGLSEAQMLQIWNHYANRQGVFRSFALPAEVVSNGGITDYVPATYRWIYSGPGQVEDLPCGGHNVSLTLETVPPVSASVIGAQLSISLRLSAGAGAGGEYAPGISESIALSLSAGNALAQIDGLLATFGLTLTAGAAIGNASIDGANLAFGLILAAGSAANAGAEGISEVIMLGLVTGVAINDTGEPEIGDAYGGGYFAGYISHTADGVATHRLIVAPAATGASGTNYTLTQFYTWKTSFTTTAGATSSFDGAANTAAIVSAGISSHPAAEFCVNLNIGGFEDWYLPAVWELDIAYFHLKPTTSSNSTSWGDNPYSVPRRNSKYTTGDPAQTNVTAFRSGQPEAFINVNHWSSTDVSNDFARVLNFSNAVHLNAFKSSSINARAFRREAI